MARKRPRAPEVLRRVFGDRVRSLSDTILSLLPKPAPSPEECRCKGRGCLDCGGPPFLLRPDDGLDYRRLLSRCFCVVSPHAPEFTELFYRRDWTQRLIVRNTMELLMDRSRPSGNVLCEGYDEQSRFSLNGELLCNAAWKLLLTRIGDTAMVYLLKFSSIFIPLPTSNHYQVTGPLLLKNPDFVNKSAKTSLVSKDQQALLTEDRGSSGCQLKRKRVKFEEKQQRFAIPNLHHSVPLPVHDSSGSISSVAYDLPQRHARPLNWNTSEMDCWVRVTEPGISKNYSNTDSCEGSSSAFLPENMKNNADSAPGVHRECPISPCSANFTPSDANFHSTSGFSPKSRKHRRLFSWKRHRKHKKVNTLDDDLNCHASIRDDKESSSRMLQKRSTINLDYKSAEEARKIICTGVNKDSELVNQHPIIIAELNPLRENINHDEAIDHENSKKLFHTNMTSTCFNCSMVHSAPKVSKRAEIAKKHMFYDSRSSTSIFPPDHILNKLKPNNSGAHALLKHIFDISDGNDLASCFHSDPAIQSGCLYHSLLKILKTLIRNAHKCHHLEFLCRHCSVLNKGCSGNAVHKSEERLLDVMKDVIQKEEYHVRKYAQIICSKELMRILYGRVCIDQRRDSDIVNSLASIRSRSSHGVLIDQAVDRKIKLVEICHLLRHHVKSNILQLGQGFYMQKSGIAQGSLLSSILCSFYYGHLERTIIFPLLGKTCGLPTSDLKNSNELNINGCIQADCRCNHFSPSKQHETCQEKSKTFDSEKEDKDNIWKSSKWRDDDSERDNGPGDDFSPIPRYLLLRLIDDFIFISTSKRQATCLFNRLRRGFREYNCYMNGEKFGLNFDVDNQSQPMPNRRYVGADGIPFLPWSGLLVNCHTLEIQADYTRYLGTHLRSSLTVHAHTKQERMGEKLCDYMRPKCHPIFYDSNINSPAIVRLNAYQAFLLCAMKFHCYIRAITPNTCDIGPLYCFDIIQKSFRYMHRLIKKRMYGMECGALNIHPVLKLRKAETIWLGLSAYIRVLRKKQSRHAKLLSLLNAQLHNLGRIDCDPSPLNYAVDDSHSSMFWQIRY